MKKLLIYISLTIIIIIAPPHLLADTIVTSHSTSSSTKIITTENELLTTILNNALILVQQIKTNIHHEKERITATQNIDTAFKKLSSESKHKIKADLNLIKQESQIFSNTRRPLQKYNSANAERSLQNISLIIQKIVESKTETVVSNAQEELMHAINKTEEIKQEAEIIINKTRADLMFNRITPVQAAKIIGEQQYIIGASERSLKKESTKAQETVEQTDNQASYVAQFASNIYDMGAKALAPFKAGYGYSQKEKDIARAIITQLEQQLVAITNTYQAAIEQEKDPRKQAKLQVAFDMMVQNIRNEMHQQQIITGEVMSTNRKLFWTTVGIAGAVIAGYYLMTPTEEALVTPVISKPVQQSEAPSNEVIPEPEPVVIPEPEVEVIPEPEVEVIPEPEVEVIPEPEIEVIPEPEVEVIPEPEVEVIPEPEVEVIPIATTEEELTPVTTTEEELTPVTTTEEELTPITTTEEELTPITTTEEELTPITTTEEELTPITTTEEELTPITTTEEELTPITTTEEELTPITTTEEELTPITTTEEELTPITTTEEELTPITTTEEELTPITTTEEEQLAAQVAAEQAARNQQELEGANTYGGHLIFSKERSEAKTAFEPTVGAPALGGTAYQPKLGLSENYRYNKEQAEKYGSWYSYFNQPEEEQSDWISLKNNPASNTARKYLGSPTKAERWILGLPEPTQEKK